MDVLSDAVPWARPVFAAGDATYTWDDVSAFAQRDGLWDRLVREVAEGIACQEAGYVASAAAVTRAATDFRYRRRLVTAEEAEAWLRRRGVAVGAWMDHVRRGVLRAEHTEELPALVEAMPLVVDRADERVWVTGRCGGLLDDWAQALAERVAAHVRLTGAPPHAGDDLDDVVERFGDAFLSAHSLEGVVDHRRLDWLHVEIEEARFGDEAAAREAALCVRHDGLTLGEVCALAGAPHERRGALLEQLDGPLRTAVLGGAEGDVLGPVETRDGYVVARLESKVVPTVDDPAIRERAAAVMLAISLRREVEEHVRWHDDA